MNTVEKILWARGILDIPEYATKEMIQQNFKQLQKQWHPDLAPDNSPHRHEMAVKINKAYAILMSYIERYQFSFTEDEIKKYYTAEEWWNSRFYDNRV